jgi:hypothetical protein
LYHFVDRVTAGRARFRVDDLIRLFRSAQIRLEISDGGALAPRDVFRPAKLIERWQKNNASIGHLVITGVPMSGPERVGELVDLGSRGVAMVYFNTFRADKERNLLQTAAHEIGHMLNLTHENPPRAYTSAMAQAAHRNTDIEAAWKCAAAEAYAQVDDPCYDPPDIFPDCFPFSLKARCRLRDLDAEELLPWGSKFFDDYADGTDDRSSVLATNHR